MAEITKDDVLSFIEHMTVLELSEFVKELEGKFGVTAAAPVSATATMAASSEEQEEEKTEFDVILVSPGDKKIQVIKEIRSITSLGLKEAKAVADETPSAVKKGISKEEADNIKKQLEEAGATIEIK